MSRPQPVLEPDTCHHITVRRNNREFNLIRQACRDLMLKRSGHFWEGRSRSSSFPEHEPKRALNTLRHIYANRKTAGMRKSHFYAYSIYGIYHCLTDDGLTEWHRAFWQWGKIWTPARGVTSASANAILRRKKKPGGFALGEAACSCTTCPKHPPDFPLSNRTVRKVRKKLPGNETGFSRILPRIRPPRRRLHHRQCLTTRAVKKKRLWMLEMTT